MPSRGDAAARRGPFGYYIVRSNGAEPRTGFVTQGDIHTTNIGLFIQDAWTINNKLTINAGVRTEREKVPAYAIGSDIPEFALDFGFEWLVKRFQTISSSNRNRRINWFDPAIFINCAGLN